MQLRLDNVSEGNGRQGTDVSARLPARIGLARLRHCQLRSGARSVEIDFGKPFGGRRLRFWARSRYAAAKLAREKSKELQRHGDASLLLTTVQRVEAAKCFERIHAAGATLTDAIDNWIKQHPAEHRNKTIRAVSDELIAAKEAGNRRERYVKDLRWKLTAFEKAFPFREIASITTAELQAWFETKGWKPVSFRSYAETLHVLFSFGVRRKYCLSNPVDEMDMPRRDGKEPEVLTVDQTEALLAAAAAMSEHRDEFVGYVVIATFCGIRPQEIQRMVWEEIKPETGMIVVIGAKAKGRARRVVTISPNCAAWLATIKAKTGPILSFDLRYYRDRLKTALGWKRWPHDVMRHSFASYHLAKHENQSATSRQLGHRNDEILWNHYRALVMPADAERFWQIMPKEGQSQ